MYSASSVAKRPAICSRCLRTIRYSRQYSSSNAQNPPPPPPSGAARLSSRRLISLHGQDAAKFLQGLLTANVTSATRSGFYTAFLNSQGRVLNDVFVYPTLGSNWHKDINKDDELGYLVDVDGEQADSLMKHLKRHKLRSKFKLRLLDADELGVYSVWKEDDRWTAHVLGGGIEDGSISLTDSRAPGLGKRLLLSEKDEKDVLGDAEEAPETAYTIRRYLRGVPEGQREISREEALPMNCNIDIMSGIDFKKGCYVGQELTIRTHHTGVVRRRILPVALYDSTIDAPETLSYDQSISLPALEHDADVRRDDKRKRATGKFIANVGNVGLAMCRLEQMSDLKVSGEGSSFDTHDRFVVQSTQGQEVGLKAFVPDWIRGNIREPKVQKRVT